MAAPMEATIAAPKKAAWKPSSRAAPSEVEGVGAAAFDA
jgi:hypothetical protein